MKGATMLATLEKPGVATSFSRPSVSNENPYSESLFRLLNIIVDILGSHSITYPMQRNGLTALLSGITVNTETVHYGLLRPNTNIQVKI
jgi:hypothetical protein